MRRQPIDPWYGRIAEVGFADPYQLALGRFTALVRPVEFEAP
jgi:hypothetical protein